MVLDSGCQMKFSGVLNFFPGVSKPHKCTDEPSIGFKKFVDFLVHLKGIVPAEAPKVTIENIVYTLTGVISQEATRLIGYLDFAGKSWIIKRLSSKEGVRRLGYESHRIHELSQAQIVGFNLLTTRFFARDQVLLIHPIGLTMFDVFDMGVKNRIAAIVWGALCQLSLLHNAGYVHGDIRPLNILLVGEHDTYLADFETCKKAGDCTGYYVDIDGFSPEEIVASPDGAMAFKKSFDFECLAYSVVYSVAKTLPWRHANSLAGMLKQRAEFMRSCESDDEWLGVAHDIWKMAQGAHTLEEVLDRIPSRM
jgi:serine/threonine protein kinase